jgi:hypothetical protein
MPTVAYRLARAARVGAAAACLLAFGALRGSAGETPSEAPALRLIHFRALDGRSFAYRDVLEHKATVFLFISGLCPVSSSYTPRIVRLERDYAPRGVLVVGVYAEALMSRAEALADAHARGYVFPVVKDERNALTDLLGATTVPQAVLVDSNGAIRYRGRIDDNAVVTRVIAHDLTDALDAVLTGKPVARTRTAAFGCTIRREPGIADVRGVPTYAANVAPILRAKCESCHRPGQVGPFALQTYAQARAWARDIRIYTNSGAMPPWKPVQGYGEFVGESERSLSDHDRAVLAAWADGGAPAGNRRRSHAHAGGMKRYHAHSRALMRSRAPLSGLTRSSVGAAFHGGWKLGEPDLVIGPDRPYHLAAEGEDVYRNFVIHTGFPTDVYLSGIEVHPGNRRVVHHLLVFVDPEHESDRLEAQCRDGEPGYAGSLGIRSPQLVGGWGPGNEPPPLADGIAVRIPKGSSLVLQTHYSPNGAPQIDQSRVGLFFARRPVEKLVYAPVVMNSSFRIPAGAARYEVRAEYTVPAGMHLLAVSPHMHLLGREIRVWAELPGVPAEGGKSDREEPIIWIRDWDFSWQNTYVLKRPLALPAGAKVKLSAFFDNSASNPKNPNRSRLRDIVWGEQTADEMCIAFLATTLDSEHLGIVPPVAPSKIGSRFGAADVR